MAMKLRRSRGRDPLGLRRVLSDRLLPALVAAMALLAALTLAGARGWPTRPGWRRCCGPGWARRRRCPCLS